MEADLAYLTLNEDEDEALRLGHSDSFCASKMELGAETNEMGWDLSLRVQSRRALTMNSVWLREDGETSGVPNVTGFNTGKEETGVQKLKDINYRRLPRGKPTGHNENTKLERPRSGESSGSSKISVFAEATNPQVVFLMETKINKFKMEKVRQSCRYQSGIEVESMGSRGGLSLAWKGNASVVLQSFSHRHINVIVEEVGEKKWRLTGFYGSPYINEREAAWNLLRRLSNQGEYPWLVCGDFNEILYGCEKKGGLPRDEKKMEEFRQVLEDCQLADLGYSGNWFTWERGNLPETNIQERLDRGVGTEEWRSLFPDFIIQHLPHSFSDHCPILINTEYKVRRTWGESFRFEAWWVLEETFLEEVRMSWGASSDRDEENLAEIINTKIHLNMEIDKDESYWEQRARINWPKLGDRNTSFFHKQASSRKKTNLIQKLQLDDERETKEIEEMKEITRSYFVKLFSDGSQTSTDRTLSGIEACISEEDNANLKANFTKEEIRTALKEMGPTKAPGEDGLPAIFYQKCWPIIGEDVADYCLQQLNKGMDVSLINKTNIVLIPKVSNPTNISQFRPISLCNVIYKVIAKAIANRLRLVLHKCIDAAQSAFVPGRLITDNVLLAYEILHTLKNKKIGKRGLMAVKLDMSKAYDRVDWNFVKKVMEKMGFDKGWVHMVLKCVSSVSYSVIINGLASESFCPHRGLRQGDPLSPFLFLFCGEGLSSLMRLEKAENIIKGVKASRNGPTISYLLFTDDCILFVEATERDAISLKQILMEYERNLGQCVNFDKSTVFFSTITQEREKMAISQVLVVRRSNDIERYLGLPSMVGKRKRASFQNLKDRFKLRIDNWSIHFLSQGGKEVFIKAILQAIPTFSMACFLLPKTLCKDLEGIIAKFWWQKSRNRKGIHWCTWKDLCRLKEDGGIGFRNLENFNVSLLAKQGWRLINYPDSLLARVLKAKYYPNTNFAEARLGNLPSLTWRSVWAARGLLEKGMCWRVGKGDKISIWDDLWISGKEADRVSNQVSNEDIKLVSDLIDSNRRRWKSELIKNTFAIDTAEKILQIPLAELAHEDLQVWRGELTGGFFNLKIKRVVSDDLCPRCRQAEEDGSHIFQKCPATIEIWNQLQLNWVLRHNDTSMWDWLTWDFEKGVDIVRKINRYITELDAVRVEYGLPQVAENYPQTHSSGRITIQFDAALDGKTLKLATGLLVRDEKGDIMASEAVIHFNIAIPFTAEAYAGLEATKLGSR
ncbi:reverse transcriptase [Gossypium australe]|uniref:Reverse transcriptase n=1 Tax=Gossypium australe TaxID=47621 RepID=A0A5B6UFE1_9ROSI|nr:reverse transcriptase [Gossypium australe]